MNCDQNTRSPNRWWGFIFVLVAAIGGSLLVSAPAQAEPATVQREPVVWSDCLYNGAPMGTQIGDPMSFRPWNGLYGPITLHCGTTNPDYPEWLGGVVHIKEDHNDYSGESYDCMKRVLANWTRDAEGNRPNYRVFSITNSQTSASVVVNTTTSRVVTVYTSTGTYGDNWSGCING